MIAKRFTRLTSIVTPAGLVGLLLCGLAYADQGVMQYTNGVVLSGIESPASGRIQYPNGAIYEGELSANQPDGRGRITYPDKTIYIGEFKDGVPDGQGVAESSDGKRVNVTADKGQFSRRYDPAELAEIEKLKRQVQANKEAQEKRADTCFWTMFARSSNGGNLAVSLANAAKCKTDPYADLRPQAPSYTCSRDLIGNVQCNPTN